MDKNDTQKCTNEKNNCDDLSIRTKCLYHRNLYHKNSRRAKRLEITAEKRKARALELGICIQCADTKVNDFCDDCGSKYMKKCIQLQNARTKTLSGKFNLC